MLTKLILGSHRYSEDGRICADEAATTRLFLLLL